ncbi:MAG: dihydropteroate synthase [Bacteroidales bacterium]|jgi:dihydropteroate synthase|nr:dihydropteroate synthase [Bacteroidales bacterium]
MKHTTININGRLLTFSHPLVMGIVNLTEDSFYDGGKYCDFDRAMARCEQVIDEGADMIDLGACSTRPGAALVSAEEEIDRLLPVIKEVKKRYPQSIISIDTVWSEVVEASVAVGADIVNDISGGQFDNALFETVACCNVPYILTHTNTTPDKMQQSIHYDNLILDISKYFAQKITSLHDLGVRDIILDLGFGFGKTLEDNYELLRRQKEFEVFDLPILTGISRKSMIYKALDNSPSEALNGTSFLHAFALENGASILRVHDVKEAVQCIKLFSLYNKDSKQ